MKGTSLVLLSSLMAVPQAMAFGTDTALDVFATSSQPSPIQPVQLAQGYDFDVYIDEFGREVVVDPRSGVVVEVRPPMAGRRPIAPPVVSRGRDGRQYYDFTDPRDVERFHRDREAVVRGGYEPYPEPDYPPYQDERYDPYGDRDYGYQEIPSPEPGYGASPSPWPEDRSVRRVPLDPPNESQNPATLDPGLENPENDMARRAFPPASGGIRVPGAGDASEDVAAFQVLLDRAGASPGVVDGRIGDNVNKAIEAYHEITGQRLRTYDKEWIAEELERTGGPAFIEYTITSEDAAGPYIASVPSDYSAKAELERLSFTRVSEMLAERFHMDEQYLIELNPHANFQRPGTIIKVANPGDPATSAVARIVADKKKKQLRAYDESGRLVSTYPATIGSSDTPSPSGTHTVERVAFNPNYTYDPKKNFKQGNNDRVLTIPPGPNGPVGSVWIALSKPTYGIHGTPEPSKIGKTYSHGCIRLSNWDAEELAKRVKPGVIVEFAE